jgi:hypothetical protein
MHLRITLLRAGLLLLASFSCTTTTYLTKDPGRFRERHPSIVGMPGSVVHFGRIVGLLTTINMPDTKTQKIVHSPDGSRSSILVDGIESPEEREIHAKELSGQAALLTYLGRSSMAFVGVLTRFTHARAAYREHSMLFSLDKPSYARVEWQDQSLDIGLPIGTTLNFENDRGRGKSSLVTGIAPTFRLRNLRTFAADGSSEYVNHELRDKTLAAYDREFNSRGFQVLFLVGYPF